MSRANTMPTENETVQEVNEYGDDDQTTNHHQSIDNIQPYKLHIFMDKYPKSSFCIALGLFLLNGIIVVLLAQSGNLLDGSSDVPMYIRDNKPTQAKDALLAGQLDASYEPRGTSTATLQQSISADVQLKLLYTFNNDNEDNGLLQMQYLTMMDDIETKLSSFEGYVDKCKRVYNSDASAFNCARHQTVTQFFDTNYFRGAIDQTYDSYPSVRNFMQYLYPSYILNNTAAIPNKNYTTANIDTITTYWSGYGEGVYNNEILPLRFQYTAPSPNGEFINNSLANVFKTVTDNKFGETPVSKRVKASLSIFFFGLPLDGYESHIDNVKEQEDIIGEWCYNELDEILSEYAETFSDKGITLRWDCATMRSYAIFELLLNDGKLLILTFVSVFVLMVYNVNSFFLGSFGMLMIFLNFLPSILLYRYISQLSYFGTLNMLGMFIILAIGADDIFVMYDTWAQIRIKHPTQSVAKRLTVTLKHAGKVMATTSLSTIFSFIGNTTSQFPAVYTFGAFSAWLVFVNYCAVIFFYPCVLVIHTPSLKRPWCVNKGCPITKATYDEQKDKGCYNVRLSDESVTERKIDKWFENVYFDRFIQRFKYVILVVFGAILLLFGIFASGLEPDPEVPQIFPSGNNYQEYRSDLSSQFATENAFQMTNSIIFGLKGIDRTGTDPTLADDIGSPIYDTDISFYLAEEQHYIAQVCDDLLCGFKSYECRYNSIWADLMITNPTATFGTGASDIKVVKCFMTEFREWVQNDQTARLNTSHIIDILDTYQLDMDVSLFDDCIFDGTFPVQGPGLHCFGLLFGFVWMNQDLPTSNPDYSAGTTNYDYWKEYIWATKNDSISNHPFGYKGKLRFIQISILLDLYDNTAYTEGIAAFEKWEEYTQNWRDDVDGTVSMDQYSNEFIPTPTGLKSISFTDKRSFAYFFLQKQIIREMFVGIFLSLSLALIVLIIATNNYIMSLMCVFVIGCIVVCVIGFTVLMGWKLGVIEAIIFVLVVGMSVDYVVHLSEAYLHSNQKYFKSIDKAKSMLGIVGGSVLSGGLSTIIGVSWLCLAEIGLLNKFGITILFLITTSLLFALVGFAAFISIFGPDGNKGNVYMILSNCYKCACCTRKNNTQNVDVVEME